MGDKVKVRTLDAETQETLVKLFSGSPQGFARFGEGGYLLSSTYEKDADNLKTMALRPDDVWVATFPRSGTHWMQELVWLLMNDHDYETALNIPLSRRYFFIVFSALFREDILLSVDNKEGELPDNLKKHQPTHKVCEAPSPRFMYTHLPLSLLPDNLLDTTKVIYVARDPRDVVVSYYHLCRFLKVYSYVGDFKTFWNLFVNGSVAFTPYFPHLKEAWARRDHPNMLFIFYEELRQNLSSSIARIAKFLGKEVTSEQIQKLCEHLDIKNFKNNSSVNPNPHHRFANPGTEGIVRNGKTGGWSEYFDEEMAAQAQRWLHAQLADTDLRFPDAPAPK